MPKKKQKSTQPGPIKKVRKRRKPLTEEEKAERADRLAKARAAKKEPKHVSVHPDVPRDESSPVNLKAVRSWIKTNKDRLTGAKQSQKLDPKNRENNSLVAQLETYVHNMQTYLRTGVWLDFRWGENMEGKVQPVCKHMAYHHEGPYKGMVKRSIGTVYPDVGLWTREMHEEDFPLELQPTKPQPKRKRRIKKKPK